MSENSFLWLEIQRNVEDFAVVIGENSVLSSCKSLSLRNTFTS